MMHGQQATAEDAEGPSSGQEASVDYQDHAWI
jgi:hypothetical protein